MSDPDGIPAHWPLNYALSARDALALLSFLAFLIVPMVSALYWVGVWFGVANAAPLRDQLHGARDWQFTVASLACMVASVMAGKYLWLIAMCRVLSRANVGPLVAFGRPRRIGRLDRALIRRLYRARGPAMESRLRPPRPVGYVCRLHGTVYAVGALLSAAIGLLPLMRGDHRPWQLAVFLGVLALLHVVLDRYTGGRKP